MIVFSEIYFKSFLSTDAIVGLSKWDVRAGGHLLGFRKGFYIFNPYISFFLLKNFFSFLNRKSMYKSPTWISFPYERKINNIFMLAFKTKRLRRILWDKFHIYFFFRTWTKGSITNFKRVFRVTSRGPVFKSFFFPSLVGGLDNMRSTFVVKESIRFGLPSFIFSNSNVFFGHDVFNIPVGEAISFKLYFLRLLLSNFFRTYFIFRYNTFFSPLLKSVN